MGTSADTISEKWSKKGKTESKKMLSWQTFLIKVTSQQYKIIHKYTSRIVWIESMVMGVHGYYYSEEGTGASFEKDSEKVSFNTMSNTT